jgi:hypothetical protein
MNIKIWNKITSEYDIISLKEVKKIPLKKAIREQAESSFYRMNAKSADCYAFSYDKIGQKYLDGSICKKVDWSGGWDWLNSLVDTSATHLYVFADKKFYQIIYK